jgi:2-desacetyl-2-hydroxyethyl bacteriochlorophyllide A dehydrogenase
MVRIGDYIKSNFVKVLEPYPQLLLLARAVYFRRRTFKGVRLRCYAPGRCTFENEIEIGPGKEQAQIETLYSAINTGTERAMFWRLPNTKAEFPYTPSSSGVGRVISPGRGLTGLKRGDLVAGPFHHASSLKMETGKLIKVLPGIDPREASLFHLCVIAIQGIRMGGIKEGEGRSIAVMGQGIIGRLATLIARAFGSDVICVTRTGAKLSKFGEQNGLSLDEPGALERLEGLSADVVIDATGDPEAIHEAMLAAREGGRIVLLGSNRGKTGSFDPNGLAMKKGLSIVGAHIRNQAMMAENIGMDYQGEAKVIQALIRNGKLRLSEAITHEVRCSELIRFYKERLEKPGETCGVIVDWHGSRDIVKKNRNLRLRLPPLKTWEGTKPLKIAIVGCGDIGNVNAAAISKSTSFELAAVMDADLPRAQALGEEYRVPFSESLEDVIADKNLDAVLLAVPHFLHSPLAQQAAAAGKHILVEKPMATSMKEARAMIGAAQQNRVVLRTFYPARFERQIRLAKALVDQDALGNLMGISMEFQRYRPMKYWHQSGSGRTDVNWRGQRELSGGGFLIMYLVHSFDYVRYITGLEVKSVFANCATLWHPIDVEDTIGMTFRGINGEVGTVSSGSAVRGQGGSLVRMWGENGQIVMDGDDLKFYSLRPVGEFRAQQWHSVKTGPRQNDRSLFLDGFRKEIEQEIETDFNEPGYLSLAVVMAAYESAKKGEPVDIGEVLYAESE